MSIRDQAFVRRGWQLNHIGTHWADCHKSHPACAYLLGWADAMANTGKPKKARRSRVVIGKAKQ
jgi:hypothetical protein